MTEKPQKKIFKILDFIMEILGWLQIVASPFLIGLILGAIVYLPSPSILRLIIGISITILGLIIGIYWANSQWKGKGTTWFMSRTMATPDLDKQENSNKTTISENKNSNS